MNFIFIAIISFLTIGIWFQPKSSNLIVCAAVSGNQNHCVSSPQLPLNQYSQIIVQQIQKGDLKYYYQVFVNIQKILDEVNDRPAVFNNVKYFVGDPWYEPANAHLRNFNLEQF